MPSPRRYKLTFYENRSTPKVSDPGEKVKHKPAYGKVTKTRWANEAETAHLAKGKWLAVDEHGNKRGAKKYKGKTGNHMGPGGKYQKRKK